MIIDSPRPGQIPGLRALWQEAFGDTDQYLDLFFQTAFSPDRCRCITKDGQVAAMLYWFDCTVAGKPFAYIFAVATAKSFRGMGLCKTLMENTHRHLQTTGYTGAVLVPAQESLFAFYGNMGYRSFGGVRRFTCPAGAVPVPLKTLTSEEYRIKRNALLAQDAVQQDEVTISFLAQQMSLYTGDDWLLSCHTDDGTVHVQEYLGDPQEAPAIVKALNCRDGHFRTPGDEPFAMYLPLAADAPVPSYFGIALD